MGEKTNSVNVRQTFQDRKTEKHAELKIERIGASEDRPQPLTPEALDRGLQGAATFVKRTAKLFDRQLRCGHACWRGTESRGRIVGAQRA